MSSQTLIDTRVFVDGWPLCPKCGKLCGDNHDINVDSTVQGELPCAWMDFYGCECGYWVETYYDTKEQIVEQNEGFDEPKPEEEHE